jgi:hypothetical protein
VLVTHAAFPLVPAVVEDPLDDVLTLLTKFAKSRLRGAWVRVWDERPTAPPGGRVLVASGAATGFVVVHDAATAPDRPHLVLGHDLGTILFVEPLSGWCRGVEWAAPREPEPLE